MPGSEATEGGSPPETAGAEGEGGKRPPDAGEELAALEAVLDRLLEAHVELRRRMERAEDERRRLSDALEGADLEGMDADAAAERFRELAEENRRLREKLEEGQERAKRIRSRLIMMEDEL